MFDKKTTGTTTNQRFDLNFISNSNALLQSSVRLSEGQPSIDTVKAAHSKLSDYGLFGKDTSNSSEILTADVNSNSTNLFKDDVNFAVHPSRKEPVNVSTDSVTWKDLKVR